MTNAVFNEQPPSEIRTARLLVRAWQPGDAPMLKQVVDANLVHLQRWMPWAMHEPSPPEVVAERVTQFADAFSAGIEWLYGIFAPDGNDLLGGCGLHPRIGPSGLEMGYWLAAEQTGKGFATEAAGALTGAALALPGIDHTEIRCDPWNLASAAVPRRLGYRLVEQLRHDAVTPAGAPRDTMVWRMTREDFDRRA
ncbi:MAG TPA: GNAT family protein [Gemmatimonadales bacterium]